MSQYPTQNETKSEQIVYKMLEIQYTMCFKPLQKKTGPK